MNGLTPIISSISINANNMFIHGSNFDASLNIFINNDLLLYTNINYIYNDTISLIIPKTIMTGTLNVYLEIDSTVSNITHCKYSPYINSISANSAIIGQPSQLLSILGGGFLPNMSVFFGNKKCDLPPKKDDFIK